MKNTVGLLALFLLTVGIVGGTRLMRLMDNDAIYAARETDLYIEKKIGLNQLATLLVDSLHVTKDKEELKWAARLLGWRKFKVGHYTLEGASTYDALLSRLAKGGQDPISLTIVPGQSRDEIVKALSKQLWFDSLAIQKLLADSLFLAEQNITQTDLIGHILPNTYNVYWTATPKEVMKRIFQQFRKSVIKPYGERFKELDKSVNEILALASIVEWESAQVDEKPKISGLYWNRLQRGMHLQSDPTVSFALKEQRRLYFSDYEVENPYNTYIHKGLPPGPINNPSLSSIKAALFPADHDYIFMVAKADGSGYHAFTKTYAQHQQKAAEWRAYLDSVESQGSK